MPPADDPPAHAVAPVASIWCRQVDNEAESPGYTSIPDDFPGLRETLESIRIVGNLTINVADTHDYWDPGPSQSLSFYPNLFLYPAAGRRYTCVGRMFLSTEDRPRLGMKTLVFSSAELISSGEFGRMVLRAHATMDGRGERRRVTTEPDAGVYQAVGDGFLFSKGTTDPVVIVASDQWEAATQAVLELVASMPAALVALGAFLVFPYFLPAGKVNFAEFSEQLPTALAVMRVARGESTGDRHEKRLKSWEEQAVTLRDLTKPLPTAGKKGDAMPLVLQYVRDRDEEKGREVARRVDTVELPKLNSRAADGDRQSGKEARKEMWRIGAAMETAAILLSKPKGRTVPMSGESARRANQYLQASPGEAPTAPTPTETGVPPTPVPATIDASVHPLPAWLRPPPQISTASTDTVGVPVSTSDDPSLRAPPSGAPSPMVAPPTSAPPATSGVPAATRPSTGAPPEPLRTVVVPAPVDPAVIDARVAAALKEQDAKWAVVVETRIRELLDAERTSRDGVESGIVERVAALEARPIVDPAVLSESAETQTQAALVLQANDLRTAFDAKLAQMSAALEDTRSELRAVLESKTGELRTALDTESGALRDMLSSETDRWRQDLDTQSSELRTVLDARTGELRGTLGSQTGELRGTIDARTDELRSMVDAAVNSASEASDARFREEIQQAIATFGANAAKSEEELRAALVAQLDVELTEVKERGTALREETESRVRKILDDRLTELDQRRSREIHDLEQRLGVLIDGRSKDLETKIGSSLTAQKDRLATIADERVGRAEQRMATEREARLAETVEAQTEALAGLQVRMQSFVETTMRESLTKERDQILGLMARLKSEVDDSLSKAVDATRLEALLRERFSQLVDAAQQDEEKSVAAAVAASEARTRAAHQELLARFHQLETALPGHAEAVGHVERAVRRELDDFDRRLKVVHDHILPMVRQTWLKVSQAEAGGSQKELRESLEREIQRVETSLLAQTTDLRERLETSVAQHGRIWLNLIHEISREESTISAASRAAARGHGPHRPARPIQVATPAAPAAPASAGGEFPPEASTRRRPRRPSG